MAPCPARDVGLQLGIVPAISRTDPCCTAIPGTRDVCVIEADTWSTVYIDVSKAAGSTYRQLMVSLDLRQQRRASMGHFRFSVLPPLGIAAAVRRSALTRPAPFRGGPAAR